MKCKKISWTPYKRSTENKRLETTNNYVDYWLFSPKVWSIAMKIMTLLVVVTCSAGRQFIFGDRGLMRDSRPSEAGGNGRKKKSCNPSEERQLLVAITSSDWLTKVCVQWLGINHALSNFFFLIGEKKNSTRIVRKTHSWHLRWATYHAKKMRQWHFQYHCMFFPHTSSDKCFR